MTTGTPPPSPSLTILTQRLRLAPFEAGEAPGLHALWSRPEVRRYLWDDEIILGFAGEHWGRGFAHETGRALVDYAFASLGFTEVRGSCDAPNQRSRRMMERLGMTLERRAVVAGLDAMFYRISRNGLEA